MVKEVYKSELVKLGKRIRQIRKQKKLTQVDLEVICHINNGDISRIENGQKNIEFNTIVRLARALDVAILDFFKEENSL